MKQIQVLLSGTFWNFFYQIFLFCGWLVIDVEPVDNRGPTICPFEKCLLISWLQSPPAVILEPKTIKSLTVSIVPPSVCHEVMGPDAMILFFEC